MLANLRTGLGLAALALFVAVLGDVLISGRLTLMPSWFFGALIFAVFAFLLHTFAAARQQSALLSNQAAQMKFAGARLQQSLCDAAAMNAKLHQSETRYKGLVDAQGDPIFRRLPDSRLSYGNEAFFKLFGLKAIKAIGHPFAPELHPDSQAPSFGVFAGLESGERSVRYDQQVRTIYGWRWIAWEDFAIRDARGAILEIQSVGRDVTERKALEEAITIARDRAEAANRAKSGFLATMSHEIRTPMNGVLGMARLLLETELRAEQRTYVEAINQSGESLLALIGDILDFSKIESGTFTLEDDEVDVRQLVEGVVELSSPRAHEKNIEIVSLTEADVPLAVRSDRHRLRQILTNLIGNAVKFTERGGVEVRVRIVQARGRHFVRFEVSDTGVGVASEKREEIFNEFVQADSTHARKFGGTGLGLAISRKLVEALDGEIGLEHVAGGGSQFWFTIPAIIVRPAVAPAAMPLAGMRVAIVTRNPVLRAGLTAQIEAAGGSLHAADASTGKLADAILADAGTCAKSTILAAPDPKLATIVLVTSAARASLPQLLDAGFAGYLVKPLRQESLIERLALQRKTPRGETDVANGNFPTAKSGKQRGPQNGLKILLAEDNPINAMVTRELLRRRGHQVTEVTSGDAALKVMEAASFDIVLTDIHMPGMDGIEAARAIRARETEQQRRRTPIVALTADALETGMRACKDAGMDGFLTKPVDPSQLDDMFASLLAEESLPRNAAA